MSLTLFLIPIFQWFLTLVYTLIFILSITLVTTLVATRNMDSQRRRQFFRTVLDLMNLCRHLVRRLREFRDSDREVKVEAVRRFFGYGEWYEEDMEDDDEEEEEEEGKEDQDEEMMGVEEDQYEELGEEELGEEEEEKLEEEEEESDHEDDDWDALSDSHSDVTTSSVSTESSSGSELSSIGDLG